MTDNTEPKQRILETATHLFGQKGYSGVGVREIAKHANVNIAMISYYYDGKPGILKEIITTFFNEYFSKIYSVMDRIGSDLHTIEDIIPVIIEELVILAKANTDLCRVALYELPHDLPEIAELKAKNLLKVKDLVAENILRIADFNAEILQNFDIIAPAFLSMIFSNFMLGSIVKNFTGTTFDDNFYKRYVKLITRLYLNGIYGVNADIKNIMETE